MYTRWSSEETYNAWLSSQDFAKAHAHVATDKSAEGKPDAPAPVAHGAQLLSFEVIERRDASS